MNNVVVNYWAVLAAAVSSMVVGSIWYGPLFGKMFMQLMGMDKWMPEKQAEEKKKMAKTYFVQFLGSLLMFWVFAWLTSALKMTSIMGAVQSAVWIWLGFIVPMKLGDALWGGKMKLFWLGVGNMLLTLLVGAVIIGAWK